MKGTIKKYSEQKGFGFIRRDDGKEAFFYRSSMGMPGYRDFHNGDRVRLNLRDTIRGPEAIISRM
jgi:CspA family cold shock protein